MTEEEARRFIRLWEQRQAKYGPWYGEVVKHLPAICVIAREAWETEQGAEAVRRLFNFTLVEVSEFLDWETRPEQIVNRYGVIVLAAAVNAMVHAAEKVQRETLQLDAFAEIIKAIHQDTVSLWALSQVGYRALASILGLPVPEDERDALRRATTLGLAISRMAPEDQRIVREVVDLDPEGAAHNSIAREKFAQAHNILLKKGLRLPSAEALRKRYGRATGRMRQDADWILKVSRRTVTGISE